MESAVLSAVVDDPARIDVHDAQLGLAVEAYAFAHQLAHLVNHALPVPREVGGALAVTARRIGIGAHPAAGARRAVEVPVGGPPDGDGRGGEIAQDRRPRHRGHHAGRLRGPEILADLDPEGEAGQVVRREDHIRAERCLVPRDGHVQPMAVVPARELALFVEFAVIGQVALGNDAQQFAPRHDQRAVVDASTAPQGGAEHQHGCKVPRCLDDRGDLRLDRVEQGHLQMQIVDGIGRKREFGIDDFCSRCRVCENACPPFAITDEKQIVRGVEKWYVDFDKCISFFAATSGCAICIAVCPWSLPEVGLKLENKLARRAERLKKK